MRKVLLLCCLISLFGCSEKEDFKNNKEYPVNYLITNNDLSHSWDTGGHIFITEKVNDTDELGCGGLHVILFIAGYNETFIVNDLACPVEWDPKIKLSIIDYYTVKCDKCGTEYSAHTGLPISGQKTVKLKQYKVTGRKITN